MRDVNDADTAGAQILDDSEKAVDFASRQWRGRLVHNNELRVECDPSSDFDQLLFGDPQFLDAPVCIQVATECLKHSPGMLAKVAPLHKGHPQLARGMPPEEDVFGDGQLRHQRQFLMNEADSQFSSCARIRHTHGLAVPLDHAIVGLDYTGDDVHEGRFAGAVLARPARVLRPPLLRRTRQ